MELRVNRLFGDPSVRDPHLLQDVRHPIFHATLGSYVLGLEVLTLGLGLCWVQQTTKTLIASSVIVRELQKTTWIDLF